MTDNVHLSAPSGDAPAAASKTTSRRGSQGVREVYRWSTADKRAPNLIGKPCVLMSEETFNELVELIEEARDLAPRMYDDDPIAPALAEWSDKARAALAKARGE